MSKERETLTSSYHLVRLPLNSKGQSVIEFLISFTFIFAFLVLFIYTAITIADGQFIHYVTFSASRLYLVIDRNHNGIGSGGLDSTDELNKVEAVMASFPLKKILPEDGKLEFRTPGDNLNKNTPYIGLIYRFKHKISPVNLFGGKEPVEFTSESFLGREPTRQECIEEIRNAFRDVIGANVDSNSGYSNTTMYDNGC